MEWKRKSFIRISEDTNIPKIRIKIKKVNKHIGIIGIGILIIHFEVEENIIIILIIVIVTVDDVVDQILKVD